MTEEKIKDKNIELENTLDEAFSKSMPAWLKPFLQALKKGNTKYYGDTIRYRNNGVGNTDALINKLIGDRNITTSRDYRKYQHSTYKINDVNLDLANANFITAPIPKTSKDKVLKGNIIPFFHISYTRDADGYDGSRLRGEKKLIKTFEQVYVKGVNDSDTFNINRCADSFDTRGSGNRAFKYVPVKDILPYVIDYCYIDLDDKTNFTTDKKRARAEMKAELVASDNYRDPDMGQVQVNKHIPTHAEIDPKTGEQHLVFSHEDPTHHEWSKPGTQSIDKNYARIRRSAIEFDKSGTRLPPPGKYIDRLNAKKATKVYFDNFLAKYYSKLVTLREYISDEFKNYNMQKVTDDEIEAQNFRKIKANLEFVTRQITIYRSILLEISAYAKTDIVRQQEDPGWPRSSGPDAKTYSESYILNFFKQNDPNAQYIYNTYDYEDITKYIKEIDKLLDERTTVELDFDEELNFDDKKKILSHLNTFDDEEVI